MLSYYVARRVGNRSLKLFSRFHAERKEKAVEDKKFPTPAGAHPVSGWGDLDFPADPAGAAPAAPVPVPQPPPAVQPAPEPRRTEQNLPVMSLFQELERLKQECKFLRAIYRSTTDAVIVAELNGQIKMVNDGARQLLELEEVEHENFFQLITDCTAGAVNVAEQLSNEHQIRNLRTEIHGLRGKATPALLTVNFVEDEDGDRSGIVAVIKDNSEAERIAGIDALTGLFNRRIFDLRVEEEYARLNRGQMMQLGLLFIDVDHFGEFNKKYGHQVGDEVLRQVAQAIRETARTTDTVCRYGGEEICVILPESLALGAEQLAARIRQRVESLVVDVSDGKGPALGVRVTISVGVATHSQFDTRQGSFQKLIGDANAAMRQAKQSGRNCVCAAQRR